MTATVHASVACLGTHGVLIRGGAGSGKSSLLLSLIFDAGAVLVADDRVALAAQDGRLVATVPDTIAGRMEVRGIGIVRRPYVSSATIDLVVDLLPLDECPRLPDEAERRTIIEGVAVPRIFIAAGAGDGTARVRAAFVDLHG